MHTSYTKLLYSLKTTYSIHPPPFKKKYACSYIIIIPYLEDIHTLFSACQQD